MSRLWSALTTCRCSSIVSPRSHPWMMRAASTDAVAVAAVVAAAASGSEGTAVAAAASWWPTLASTELAVTLVAVVESAAGVGVVVAFGGIGGTAGPADAGTAAAAQNTDAAQAASAPKIRVEDTRNCAWST